MMIQPVKCGIIPHGFSISLFHIIKIGGKYDLNQEKAKPAGEQVRKTTGLKR
jgi:hypothetical protein